MWKPVEHEKLNVVTISEKGGRVSVTTEAFSAFFREELELFQPAIKKEGDDRVLPRPIFNSSGEVF